LGNMPANGAIRHGRGAAVLDYDTRSVRPRIAKHTPDHGCSQKGSRSPQGQCHLMVAEAGFAQAQATTFPRREHQIGVSVP
jgi:hypothetical protein